MDNTIIYVMMISIALLMAMLPFGVFLGLGTALGIASSDTRLFATYILAALVVSYLTSLGAFALIQRANCGSVKNMKQIATNASFSLAFQAGTMLIISLVPFLRTMVSGLLPPDLDPSILTAVEYSYYSLWASLYGTAIGGTLSGICTA